MLRRIRALKMGCIGATTYIMFQFAFKQFAVINFAASPLNIGSDTIDIVLRLSDDTKVY